MYINHISIFCFSLSSFLKEISISKLSNERPLVVCVCEGEVVVNALRSPCKSLCGFQQDFGKHGVSSQIIGKFGCF